MERTANCNSQLKRGKMKKILLKEKNKAILTLTLNDPKKLNALSEEMLNEIEVTLKKIKKDKTIKVVIIQSSTDAFCAGHDLKEMQIAREQADGKDYYKKLFKKCSKIMKKINSLPQPVIAIVEGVAAAAGCQLVATCDLAVGTENATFGVNGINIGLFCSTPMVALTRNIGKKKTFEMLITGEFIDAFEAKEHGLLNSVYKKENIKKEVLNIAEKICGKSSKVVKVGKKAFYKQSELNLKEAYNYTSKVMTKNILYEDTKEGMQAFIEKREPNF